MLTVQIGVIFVMRINLKKNNIKRTILLIVKRAIQEEQMKFKIAISLVLFTMSFSLLADQSFYCPQNHAYINIGMTTEEVIAACGQPLSKQDSNQPIIKKIPMQELIYNNKGTDTAFYGVWNIPTGSGGTQMEIDIVNNKVKEIKMNSAGANESTVCEDANIQLGDDVAKVYNGCGSPSIINNTFIDQVIPTAEPPKVWIYQANQYDPPVSMTFVDGRLKFIK